jgi:hypothetical protein
MPSPIGLFKDYWTTGSVIFSSEIRSLRELLRIKPFPTLHLRLFAEKIKSDFYNFSIRTAQTFNSGILATGSKAVRVSWLAAASA